jgi:hypothetical protein
MEDLLIDKEQLFTMDLGTKPSGMSKKYWEKIEREASRSIQLYLSYSMLLNVFRNKLWDKLWNLY